MNFNKATYEQIVILKEHPVLHLGEKSIVRLSSYLSGWIDGSKSIQDFDFLYFFGEWIKKTYSSDTRLLDGHSWSSCLLILSNNSDAAAFDLFFDLLFNFMNEERKWDDNKRN